MTVYYNCIIILLICVSEPTSILVCIQSLFLFLLVHVYASLSPFSHLIFFLLTGRLLKRRSERLTSRALATVRWHSMALFCSSPSPTCPTLTPCTSTRWPGLSTSSTSPLLRGTCIYRVKHNYSVVSQYYVNMLCSYTHSSFSHVIILHLTHKRYLAD